jgi:hypothetical protein
MVCRQKQIRKPHELVPNFSDLEEKGRLHFFYHSPSSELPVRDILNKQNEGHKTEPYIEKNAENYCCECNQANIRGFLKGGEKYLFLFTTCRNEQSKHLGKVYIVGYIEKQRYELRPGGFYAAIGPLKLFSFDDAYYLGKSGSHSNPRQLQKKLNRAKTKHILDQFEDKKDILGKCRIEVERLKKQLPVEVRREQAIRCK